MLIHISYGIKYQFLKKIYDVINKAYTYKFENLTIFIAFPLPSMETGTKFHVFQSDLAPKRTWWPIFLYARLKKRSYYVIPLGVVRPSVRLSVRPSVNIFVSV